MLNRNCKKSMMLTFCFVLLLGLIAPYSFSYSGAIAAEAAAVEVPNGDFEEVKIPGWSVVTSNTLSKISNSKARVHSGSKSLHFNNPSNEEQFQIKSELVPVTAGESYTAKAFVNVVYQSHSLGYEVHYFNDQNEKVGAATFINFGTATLGKDQWTEIRVPFVAPAGATQVQLRFNSGKVAITEAYIDDVAINTASEENVLAVVNAGFEEEVTIPGWSLVTQNSLSRISISEARVYTGLSSLHFDNPSNLEQLQVTSDMIPVTAGEPYTAKAWVNVIRQSHSIGYEVHYYNNQKEKIGSPTFINFKSADLGTNQWTEISVPFTVPAGATQVQLRFNSGTIAVTEAYFDDVTIVGIGSENPPVETPSSEIVNPSFEAPLQDGNISGWTSEFVGPGISISTQRARTGMQSLHLLDTTDKAGVSVLSDKIAIEPGKSYLLSVYTNVVNQTHNIVTEIRYFDGNNNRIIEHRQLNGNLPKNEWSVLKVFSEAPNNAAYARLSFYSGGISFTEAYFDDVTLEKVTDDSQLDRKYAPSTNLGEMVSVQLGQAGAIQENILGENEVYYHSNGHPGTFSVLDAETGELKFSKVIPNTEAVWAITIGPDKNVYFAGTSDGKLYRYVPALKEVQELGANPSAGWVWDLEATTDGKIYGATYPGAGVFEYDINTGKFKDFGSVIDQEYARGLAVDGDFIYVGIGTTKHLYKINRHTGEKEEIIIEGQSGENGIIQDIWAVNGKLLVAVSTVNMLVIDPATNTVENSFVFSNMISEPDPDQPN
ncbi:carbohydrate binding domain-containing protein, partial [Neobacillus niacini]|uniref:carbohydrate binding domain-containing protein n=1 Tax=Neobacillus niacini TaxID=86668 RepID=UPI003002EFFD